LCGRAANVRAWVFGLVVLRRGSCRGTGAPEGTGTGTGPLDGGRPQTFCATCPCRRSTFGTLAPPHERRTGRLASAKGQRERAPFRGVRQPASTSIVRYLTEQCTHHLSLPSTERPVVVDPAAPVIAVVARPPPCTSDLLRLAAQEGRIALVVVVLQRPTDPPNQQRDPFGSRQSPAAFA
jgi:hypothetical protein